MVSSHEGSVALKLDVRNKVGARLSRVLSLGSLFLLLLSNEDGKLVGQCLCKLPGLLELRGSRL